MRDRKRTIALLLIVFGIAWGMMYAATLSSQGGRVSPFYSTYRYDASGTAALRELFTARGLKVSLLERGRMRSTDHGVLFQVLALPSEPSRVVNQNGVSVGFGSEVDTQSLLDWIAQGNTVVQFSRDQTGLMVALERDPTPVAPSNFALPYVASMTQPATAPTMLPYGQFIPQNYAKLEPPAWSAVAMQAAEVAGDLVGDGSREVADWFDQSIKTRHDDANQAHQKIEVIGPGLESVAFNSRWKKLCVKGGKTIAAERQFGRGRIIIIGSPTPALNGALAWSDNAAIMLSLAGDGPVLLDEWSHGQPHDDSVMGMIYQVGLWPVLLQAIIALLLYVWSTAGYRRINPPEVTRRPSSHDQVRTLGYLYGRSLSPGVAATRIYTEVLSRVAAAERCSPSQVQARLAAGRPEAAQRLQRILADVASAAQTQGPACMKCGYSLAGSVGPDCPDCGTPIPLKTRELIAVTPVDVLSRHGTDAKPAARGFIGLYYKIVGSQANPSHLVDDILVRALTDSHQLALEITRGRRNSR